MRLLISFLTFMIVPVTYAAEEKVIASLANEPIGFGNYLQMFFGLFIIVGLIVGLAWFMRRMGSVGGTTTGNLKVLGGVSVGQRERVVLLQAGETQLLLGVAPGEVRAIHVLDKPITDITDSSLNNSSGFAEKLHSALKSRGHT